MAKIKSTVSLVKISNNKETINTAVYTGTDYIALFADGRCCKEDIVLGVSVLQLADAQCVILVYDMSHGIPEDFMTFDEVFGIALRREGGADSGVLTKIKDEQA